VDPVERLTDQFRDYINNPRIQAPLMTQIGAWMQICSCLDVLGDCQLVIQAYQRIKTPALVSELYLAIYGALQACFVQQDATFHLCQALGVVDKVWNYPALVNVRSIRNDAIGHPTRRTNGASIAYNFIVRASLEKDGFEIHSVDNLGQSRNRYIKLDHVIDQQGTYVGAALRSAMQKVRRADRDHRRRFRMDNLSAAFPESTDYHLGKILEVTSGSAPWEFGKTEVMVVRRALLACEEALVRRGMDLNTYDAIKYGYRDIGFPLDQIEGLFNGTVQIDTRAAYIFAYYLRIKISELREVLREIDNEYDA